jgi:acetylglutamate kinase
MTAPATTSRAPARPIVIKIGGVALEDQRQSPALWRALLALHARSPVVLVHGGGKAVDRLLDRLGMPTHREDGIRITPEDQMDVIAGVLAGSVNKSLVGAINASRADQPPAPESPAPESPAPESPAAPAVGLCLGDAATLRTRKATRYPFDPGRVGESEGGDPSLVTLLLAQGFMPVVSSIGLDAEGQFLNVNADDAAASLARVLRANSLVLLTDVPGVKAADSTILPTLSATQADALIATNVIAGGMVPKVRAALAIATDLAIDVTIMSGQDTNALAAWSRGNHVGTRILAPRNPAPAFTNP